MLTNRRLLAVLILAALAMACGPDENVALKIHDSSRDAVTQCAGSTTLPGIDVSDYQGTINWAQVKGAGIKWAYAKATEGTGFQATTFPANWSGMKANGITRGAYHFFHAELDGKTQADYFLNYINAHGGLAAGDLPPMLDWEQVNPDNGGASCSTAVANAQAFVNEITAKTGKKTIIYTSPGIWGSSGSPDGCGSNFSAEPLFEADYFVSDPSAGSGCYTSDPSSPNQCPNTPGSWGSWTMWQYGDCGSVNGISGHVDIDIFNGDAAALAQLAGQTDCGGKADGYYCAGDGPTGPTGTLYKCASNVATVEETCPGWCVTNADGDFCARVHRPEVKADLDKDGRADVCARNSSGLKCWLAGSAVDFSSSFSGPAISDSSGWGGIAYYTTTQFADVDGDGKADFCARGAAGALCWFGSGNAFSNPTTQTVMTNAQGWDQAEFRQTIQWADVNGDGKADLCGRQYNTFSCWLYDSTSNSFKTEVDLGDMGDPQGWNVVQYYSTIVVADVTGDKKADVCGRGYGGFECFTAKSGGFNAAGAAVSAFSDPNGGDKPDVYTTIALADVTGDGKPDVCGRVSSGYECFKGNGDGTFSTTAIAGPALSNSGNWNKPQYYSTIQLADIDGDGKADVCARAAAGIKCWLSTGNGFASTAINGPALSDSAGWNAGAYDTTIRFVDVDGDGRADVCGRSPTGLECWLSTGNGFASTPIAPAILADTGGWAKPQYLTTIDFAGNAFGRYVPTSTSTSTSGSSGSTTSGGSSSSSGTSTATTGTSSSSTGTSSSSTASSDSGSSSGSTTGSDTTASTGSTGGNTTDSTGGSGSTLSTGSTSGGDTAATTAGGSSGTSSEGGTLTSGSPGTTGSSGGTVSGGCASANGGELFALLALVGLIRRRR